MTSLPASWTSDSFRWTYTEGDRCEFHLDGIQPVYFDGTRARTRNWLATKHEAGAMHEPNFAYCLARLIEILDPEVYFDVGGFIGYFSILPLAWTRQSTRIVTFEMNPKFVRQIQLNLEQNRHLAISRSFVVNAGISDAVMLATDMHIDGFTLDSPGTTSDTSTIDVLTLDYVHETMGLTPDLVKMDIEGFEAPALAGASRLLAEVRPTILFELHSDELLAPHGETRASMLDLFDTHEYVLHELAGERYSKLGTGVLLHVLDGSRRDELLEIANSALVAVPRERVDSIAPLVNIV